MFKRKNVGRSREVENGSNIVVMSYVEVVKNIKFLCSCAVGGMMSHQLIHGPEGNPWTRRGHRATSFPGSLILTPETLVGSGHVSPRKVKTLGRAPL